jgi:hypothetical protein
MQCHVEKQHLFSNKTSLRLHKAHRFNLEKIRATVFSAHTQSAGALNRKRAPKTANFALQSHSGCKVQGQSGQKSRTWAGGTNRCPPHLRSAASSGVHVLRRGRLRLSVRRFPRLLPSGEHLCSTCARKNLRKTHRIGMLANGCETRTPRSFLSRRRTNMDKQKLNVNKWDCHTLEIWRCFVGESPGALHNRDNGL